MIQKGRTSAICQTCRNKEEFLYNKFKIPLIKNISKRKYEK